MKTKVSERGQTQIPAEIRKQLGIEPEQELEWSFSNGVITVRPVPKDPVAAFRGAGNKSYTSRELLKDRREERAREDAKQKSRRTA